MASNGSTAIAASPIVEFVPPAAVDRALALALARADARAADAAEACGGPRRWRLASFATVRVEHSCRDAFGAVLTLAPAPAPCAAAAGGASCARCASSGAATVIAYSGDTVPCAALAISAYLTGEPLSGERLMAVAVVLGGVALGVYASARRLR